MFESRSSTGGGRFWGPLPPYPPSALGSGLPALLPGIRASRPALSALLLDFFLASSPASRGPGARASRSTSRMPGPGFQASRCPGIRSTSRTAFMGPVARARLSGARASALLPCFQEASSMLSGGHAFRRFSGGHASPGLPGVRASLNFFLRSICAFCFCFASSRLSVFRRPRARLPPRLPGSMLSGDRGPEARSQGPDFQPPCFQGLSGGQGPGPLWVFFQDMILSLHLLFLAACINIHIFRI